MSCIDIFLFIEALINCFGPKCECTFTTAWNLTPQRLVLPGRRLQVTMLLLSGCSFYFPAGRAEGVALGLRLAVVATAFHHSPLVCPRAGEHLVSHSCGSR